MATQAKFFLPHNRKSPPNALINPYRTADGRWLLLIAAQAGDWPRLAKALGAPELLADARFATENARTANAAALVERIDAILASCTLTHWTRKLGAARIVYAVLDRPNQMIGDRQMIANAVYAALFEPFGGAGNAVNSPLWLAGYDHAPDQRLAA